ncbi:MAG: hypothetical protein R6U13_12885 [Desulfatiglandaceae bacterium]
MKIDGPVKSKEAVVGGGEPDSADAGVECGNFNNYVIKEIIEWVINRK